MTGPSCRDDARRDLLRASGRGNGIDFAEVEQGQDGPELHLHLMRSLPPDAEGGLFAAANVRIEGGRRVADVGVDGEPRFVPAPDPARDDLAVLRLTKAGDSSPYTVRLVDDPDHPMPHVDPLYRTATFTFDGGGPSELDCVTPSCPAPPPDPPPEVSYLAKDYAGFRRLLLDRLATTLPQWRDAHAADPYVTVLEVLAYEADRLSYVQDAVTTEAYLDTARLRTSVRRHVRLVDYPMHEGATARAWVCVVVAGETVRLDADAVAFLTHPEGLPPATRLLERDLRRVDRHSYEVFEPLLPARTPAVTAADVVAPEELAGRLRDDPALAFLRLRLPDDDRAALDRGGPDLAARLADVLTGLLGDRGFALRTGESAQRGLHRHGSYTALTGDRLAAHNRRELAALFPDELAPAGAVWLHEAHNVIRFHTWGRRDCCLPAGATSATLRDEEVDGRRRLRHLRPGAVLVLEEVRGPRSGDPADADPAQRHPVRLIAVEPGTDPLGDVPVVEVSWAPEDALVRPLVLTARGSAPDCAEIADVAVARGNAVLVDHGETARGPDSVRLDDDGRALVAVPFPAPDDAVPAGDLELCCTAAGTPVAHPLPPPRYTPAVPDSPLVFAEPLTADLPARSALVQDPQRALPALAVYAPLLTPRRGQDVVERAPGEPPGPQYYARWTPRRDLLASRPSDAHVVAEVDDDGVARLRFGNGELGRPPTPGARMCLSYRVGGGPAGNAGADAITHVVLRAEPTGGRVVGVRNPLSAVGGVAPEPVDEVRLRAPHAFRARLERAVIADDYAAIAMRDFDRDLERALARTGVADGRTFVTVCLDPRGTSADDPALRERVREHLERFRRIGHTVRVEPVRYAPVDLTLAVRLRPGHRAGDVRAALRDRLGSATPRGLLHPDALTFGRDVALSAVVGAALGVPGVAHVTVERLARHGAGPDLPDGDVLVIDAEEIARMDDDPDLPENGILQIRVEVAP